jgi:predicted LPLAT superfamily acyltransferase
VKSCVIIPVYNHGEALAGTVDRLSAYRLPTIIIDDGSDSATRDAIAVVVSRYGLDLVTLPENRGKGAAVEAGMRAAWGKGYTHAIQLDADGQHDVNDIETFLERARKSPDALVTGVPQFDDSIPRGRYYGRLITRFWVCIETLSLNIPDTMCGFRVYPLESCIDLLEERKLGRRMDFDTEIAVRLFWRGVDLLAVPTRVTYPQTGISHFRLWRDNWLITRMHTVLFFGMLIRLPMLVSRKLGARPHHWSRLRERGGTLGLKILFATYRIFGRRTFRLLLYPVMTYFYLTSPQARRASGDYLRRVERQLEKEGHRPARRLSSFRHFIEFGESILDKTATWSGEVSKVQVRHINPAVYDDLQRKGRGGIFIGSHLGYLEALRAFGGIVSGMTVNALVFTRHSLKFMEFLEEANPKAVEHLIQVDTIGPETIGRLNAKIDAGEWIAMVADRTPVSQERRAIYCDFLGSEAPFPQGPFILAALLKCPVYLLFCLKIEDRYNVYLEPFADPLELPRQTRHEDLHRAVTHYAKQLERRCLTAPYQWFNFFDFWEKSQPQNGA